MTTLIDRILSQIIPAFVDYNLRTKKHIIEYGDTPETLQLAEDRLNIEKQLEYNLRQILEAELTAVMNDLTTKAPSKDAIENIISFVCFKIEMIGVVSKRREDEFVGDLRDYLTDLLRSSEAYGGKKQSEDKVCTACYGKKGYSVFHQDNSKDDFTGKDLGKGKTWESLETCPRCNGTGEEPKKPEKPEIMLQPGQYMRDNEGNITTYEDEQKERLKDSQPKEVKPIYDAKDPESNRKHIIEDMC